MNVSSQYLRVRNNITPLQAIQKLLKILKPNARPSTKRKVLLNSLRVMNSTESNNVKDPPLPLKELTALMKEQSPLGDAIEYAKSIGVYGNLNMGGLETLRKIESMDLHERGLIPSSTTVGNIQRRIEEIGEKFLSSEIISNGDGWQYTDFDKPIELIFRMYGLHEVAKEERVECLFTLDGALLTDNLGHVTAGK